MAILILLLVSACGRTEPSSPPRWRELAPQRIPQGFLPHTESNPPAVLSTIGSPEIVFMPSGSAPPIAIDVLPLDPRISSGAEGRSWIWEDGILQYSLDAARNADTVAAQRLAINPIAPNRIEVWCAADNRTPETLGRTRYRVRVDLSRWEGASIRADEAAGNSAPDTRTFVISSRSADDTLTISIPSVLVSRPWKNLDGQGLEVELLLPDIPARHSNGVLWSLEWKTRPAADTAPLVIWPFRQGRYIGILNPRLPAQSFLFSPFEFVLNPRGGVTVQPPAPWRGEKSGSAHRKFSWNDTLAGRFEGIARVVPCPDSLIFSLVPTSRGSVDIPDVVLLSNCFWMLHSPEWYDPWGDRTRLPTGGSWKEVGLMNPGPEGFNPRRAVIFDAESAPAQPLTDHEISFGWTRSRERAAGQGFRIDGRSGVHTLEASIPAKLAGATLFNHKFNYHGCVHLVPRATEADLVEGISGEIRIGASSPRPVK